MAGAMYFLMLRVLLGKDSSRPPFREDQILSKCRGKLYRNKPFHCASISNFAKSTNLFAPLHVYFKVFGLIFMGLGLGF